MKDSQLAQCHKIIHTAMAAAAAVGGGLAQIPAADVVPITAAQITMIIYLGAVFDIPVSQALAKALLKGFKGAVIGRFLAQILRFIPVFGNVINASIAGVITEKIGWAAAEKFDKDAQQKVIPSSL